MTRIQRFSIVAAMTPLLACVVGCEPDITDADIKYIDTPSVRQLTVSAETNPHAVLLIDPRAPDVFAVGHIPGAKNIDLPAIDRDGGRKKWIEAYSEIVVYGDNPGSAVAKALTKRLLHLKYSDVFMYGGGMMEWQKAGFPVKTGAEFADDIPRSPTQPPPLRE
jgi:rhodanese-related sulfurtransferase